MAFSGGDWSGRGTEGIGHPHGVRKPGTWGDARRLTWVSLGGWM